MENGKINHYHLFINYFLYYILYTMKTCSTVFSLLFKELFFVQLLVLTYNNQFSYFNPDYFENFDFVFIPTLFQW